MAIVKQKWPKSRRNFHCLATTGTHSLLPEQKADWVKAHDAHDTLYIGDGANDSLAFDAASCTGSPVSGRSFLEHKADFYFLGHSMKYANALLDIACQHRRAVHRVFGFALLYNIATVIAGLMGHLSPLAAAVLMPSSSVVTLSLVAWTFRRRPLGNPSPEPDEPQVVRRAVEDRIEGLLNV